MNTVGSIITRQVTDPGPSANSTADSLVRVVVLADSPVVTAAIFIYEASLHLDMEPAGPSPHQLRWAASTGHTLNAPSTRILLT